VGSLIDDERVMVREGRFVRLIGGQVMIPMRFYSCLLGLELARWSTVYLDVLGVDCSLRNFVDDRLCRRGGETDLLIEQVVSLRRVDVMLLNHQRKRI
jgi:hypothetical protein